MDVQAYDDEAEFFLKKKNGAQKEEVWMICLVSQGSITHFIP